MFVKYKTKYKVWIREKIEQKKARKTLDPIRKREKHLTHVALKAPDKKH